MNKATKLFWIKIINQHTDEIKELKELIKKMCPHKTLTQKNKWSSWFYCDVCGEGFIEESNGMHPVAPKGSILCRYKCGVKK